MRSTLAGAWGLLQLALGTSLQGLPLGTTLAGPHSGWPQGPPEAYSSWPWCLLWLASEAYPGWPLAGP